MGFLGGCIKGPGKSHPPKAWHSQLVPGQPWQTVEERAAPKVLCP